MKYRTLSQQKKPDNQYANQTPQPTSGKGIDENPNGNMDS